MTINGDWTLHFSWGATNNYSQTDLIFNNDGTFTGPTPGKWRLRDGTVMLSFNTGPAKYGGNLDGNVASGAMSTFAGLEGCWYLMKQGTNGLHASPAHNGSYDPSGNRMA